MQLHYLKHEHHAFFPQNCRRKAHFHTPFNVSDAIPGHQRVNTLTPAFKKTQTGDRESAQQTEITVTRTTPETWAFFRSDSLCSSAKRTSCCFQSFQRPIPVFQPFCFNRNLRRKIRITSFVMGFPPGTECRPVSSHYTGYNAILMQACRFRNLQCCH
ncbi:hypothetical protein SAMN02744775_00551 [Enterobacter sp. CC120223-11]|nr:hypothetical protein SAMN02744775_00551 [Enterobacter sp. CC120223-11]